MVGHHTGACASRTIGLGVKRRSFAGSAIAAAAAIGLARARSSSAAPASTRIAGPLGSAGPAIARDYFGMHFHRLLPDVGARRPTEWPPGQVGALRLWDSTTRWADIAPRRDRWDFDRLDAHVALAEANGAPVLHTLGSTPRWASARPDEPGPYGPGCAAEPRAMSDWQDYVSRVAMRYRGRIATYEVWNEPYFSELVADRGQPGFFSGSVAQMVEMTRIARDAIRAADPDARLATPGFVNGTHRLDRFLEAGGAGLVDVVAYHFYARDADQFSAQIAEVRAVTARRGVAHLPLWNTECGVERMPPRDSPRADAEAADSAASARLAQFLILGAAARLGRFYYHAWDNDQTGMVDRSGTANARAPAWREAMRWLLDSTVAPAVSLGSGAYRVDAVQRGVRYATLWSEQRARVDPRWPTGWHAESVEKLTGGATAAAAFDPATRGLVLGPAPVRVRLAQVASS